MPDTAARVVAETSQVGSEVRLLLTVREAAHCLGIGRTLMYELLATGRVPSITVGRLRRVPYESLQAFVAVIADHQNALSPATD